MRLAALLVVLGAAGVAVAAPPPIEEDEIAPPDEGPQRLPPPAPSPVADVAAHAQELVGKWACKGVVKNADGSSRPRHAAMTVALDLDGAWVSFTTVESGESTGKRTTYRTFDPVAVQWSESTMASGGVLTTATSAGEDKGVWTFAGVEKSAASTIQVKHHEERAKGALVLWGEALLGGAWVTTYETSCVKDAP